MVVAARCSVLGQVRPSDNNYQEAKDQPYVCSRATSFQFLTEEREF